jgi:hypothetical protein
MTLNDKVYIDNQDGTYTSALFKGDISDTLALVKPKEKFCKGGYGQTITCLKKLIVTEVN